MYIINSGKTKRFKNRKKGLSLQELSEQTGISRASLGNYETDDYKEFSHKAIITLADFYGVTSDYLLGLTENREQYPFPVDELGLDDETVDLLKSGTKRTKFIFLVFTCFLPHVHLGQNWTEYRQNSFSFIQVCVYRIYRRRITPRPCCRSAFFSTRYP